VEPGRGAYLRSFASSRTAMVSVKICGLTRLEDAAAAARAGADLAGLVFHLASPRHLSPDRASAIAQKLRGRVRIVVLLVNPGDDAVAQAVAAAGPDYIQLHGNETPERVADVRARFGIPVIKALGIADENDFAASAGYEAVADMLLFDAKAPAGAAAGGCGLAFDWRLLRGRTIRTPWLLAGGLNVQNVARAIAAADAKGVDVSSGVEISPGIKDAQAIHDFVAAARAPEFAAEQPA
jgi:phosphoribosylanthranilate isomerase